MDNDAAGQAAIEKSYDVFRRYNMMVYVVPLTEKDPADFLSVFGRLVFEEILLNAVPMVKFLFQRALLKYDKNKIENIQNILNDVLPALQAETDLILLDRYVSDISRELKINPELLMAKIKKNRYTPKPIFSNQDSDLKKSKMRLAEEYLIAESVSNLEKRKRLLALNFESLLFSENAKFLLSYFSKSQHINKDFLAEIEDPNLKVYLTQIILNVELDSSETTWTECVKSMQSYYLDQRIDQIKKRLKFIEEQDKNKEVEEELISLMIELQALKEQKNY
jgi:DNA primase